MMIAALLGCALLQAASEPVRIRSVPDHIAVVDLDGDGALEMVAVRGGKAHLLHGAEVAPLELPGRATLWTVADLGRSGVEQFLVLVDGKELRPVRLSEGELELAPAILTGLDATPPMGLHTAAFVRDLDGNGWPDLVLPRAGAVRIWHGSADGFHVGPEVEGLARLSLATGERGEGLLEHYERALSVPEPDTEDISGDGRPDLLVRHDTSVSQYVAGASGFPEQASVEIELDDFRQDFSEKSLDLTNLTKLLKYIVVDEWADLNGDGIQDLLVLSNGKVRIFLGGDQGVSLDNKKRPVKLDGNIFYAKVAQIDDDGIPDLVLIGVQDLGLAELAFSLITSFRLRFDFYAFRGKGDGSFHPRMYKQKKVVVEGGRLLKVIDENQEQLSQMREAVVRVGDFNGDGKRDDLAMLEGDGRLGVWLGAVPSDALIGNASAEFLRRAFADRKDLKVDVTTLTEWVLGRTSALITAGHDRIPDWETRLGPDWDSPHALHVRDIDGDGHDEVLVLRRVQPPASGDGPRPPAELQGWIHDPGL